MFLLYSHTVSAKSDSIKKTYFSFTINGKKKSLKNSRIFLTNDAKKIIECKISQDNVIEFPLSELDKSKKYTLNFTCCNSNMKFGNISYKFLETDQNREFQFEIEKKPFKKAENLSEEEYQEKKLVAINYLKVNPYEHGSGIMLLEKIYK